MLDYFEKNKSYIFSSGFSRYRRDKWNIAREKHFKLEKLYARIITYLMLTMFCKIGLGLNGMFSDFTDASLYNLNYGLVDNLPNAKMSEKIVNKRVVEYIIIDHKGNYQIEGYCFTIDSLEEYLQNRVESLPSLVVQLVVDKRCKYQYVEDVLQSMRKVGARKVSFATKRIKI